MIATRILVSLIAVVLAALPAAAQRAVGGNIPKEQENKGVDDSTPPPAKKDDKQFPLGNAYVAVSLNGKPFTGVEKPGFTFNNRAKWIAVMRASIAMSSWRFASDRMIEDYVARVYRKR